MVHRKTFFNTYVKWRELIANIADAAYECEALDAASAWKARAGDCLDPWALDTSDDAGIAASVSINKAIHAYNEFMGVK